MIIGDFVSISSSDSVNVAAMYATNSTIAAARGISVGLSRGRSSVSGV